MSEETANQQSCGGKKLAMLSYVELYVPPWCLPWRWRPLTMVCAPSSRRAACSTAALKLLWLRAALKLNLFATAMAAEIQDQPFPRVAANTLEKSLCSGRDQAFDLA